MTLKEEQSKESIWCHSVWLHCPTLGSPCLHVWNNKLLYQAIEGLMIHSVQCQHLLFGQKLWEQKPIHIMIPVRTLRIGINAWVLGCPS